MKHILVVIGTRPEAIKMVPVILELKKQPNLKTTLCVTGQHKELVYQVLDLFNIVPDVDFSIMSKNQTLSNITERILAKLDSYLDEIKPDFVLVHGDTTTAFTTALSCFYKQIPIGHVEAGLRTFNINSPFPEEFNRRAIGLMTKIHFAPTEHSKQNLINEGIAEENIIVTGNTCIDTLKYTIKENYTHPLLEWASDSKLVLVTLHRRENHGQTYYDILRTINKIANDFPEIKIIFSTHPNPKLKEKVKSILGNNPKIKLTDPLGVVDFHNILNNSYFIITDSGGLQEEASFLKKPLLLIRENTERPEGVMTGSIKIATTNSNEIYFKINQIIKDEKIYSEMVHSVNPFGSGKASIEIINYINYL